MPKQATSLEDARETLDLSPHADQIRELFAKGYSFARIKRKLGLNFEPRTPQNIAFNLLIPETMGRSWKELRAEHQRLYAKARNKGGAKARALALERDEHHCVLSGDANELHVHHINGDPFNHELVNLVTISRGVHGQLHKGKRVVVVRLSRHLKRVLGLKAEAVSCPCCSSWRVKVDGEIAHPDE
jgi:hypothetical protein